MYWPMTLLDELRGLFEGPPFAPIAIIATAVLHILLYHVYRVLFPTVDSREPPILRPKIPFFGHVISLVRERTGMFGRL